MSAPKSEINLSNDNILDIMESVLNEMDKMRGTLVKLYEYEKEHPEHHAVTATIKAVQCTYASLECRFTELLNLVNSD